MRIAFIAHFRGTYKRPHTARDLQQCLQGKNETSRVFLSRWLETRNACEGVADETCMLAFINGLQKGSYMRHKLQCDKNAGILTLNDMIHYASNCAAVDDDAGGTLPAMLPSHKKKNNNNNGNNNSNNNGKRKNLPADQQTAGSDNLVAMMFQRGSQGGGRGRGRSSGAGRGQQHAETAQATGTCAPQSYEEYRDMPS